MSDKQDLFPIKDAPADLDCFVKAIVLAPSFDMVRLTAGSSRSVVVGYITLSVTSISATKATYVEMELDTIRDVIYDCEIGEYSFTGRHRINLQKASTRSALMANSAPAYYKVTLRDQIMESHMHVIKNPRSK